MNTRNAELTIFTLSQHLWHTEWASLMGDKYREALPFRLRFVNDVKDAKVIAWNGLVTSKSAKSIEPIIDQLNHGSILLLMGEKRTLLEEHPYVDFDNSSKWRVVELPGWSVLPEEILKSMQECWELLNNV